MKRILAVLLVSLMLLGACASAEVLSAADVQATFDVIPETDSWREEITVISGGNVTSLDPNTFWSYQTNEIYRVVYDTLLTYKDGVYGPRVATAWEWTNETTLHLTLRDDVYFSNGEKLTTADVEFSLNRCNYGSVVAYYDHCNIISDTEMEIVLNKPCVEFMFFLADTSTGIVCKSACEADEEWGFTISSGPFHYDLEKYLPGDSVTVVRNESYWGEPARSKRIVFRILTNTSVALAALENGEADWVANLYATEVAQAEANEDLYVFTYGTSSLQYLAFNTVNGGSITDINLRKAIAYAIDKELLTIAAGQEGAKLADSFWGWNETGYFDDFEEVYSYNPEKAKEYVALVEDPSFTIMVNGSYDVQKNIAIMLQEMCAQVGITATIEETDPAGISANTKWGSANHELLVYNMSLSDSNTSMWEFYLDQATKNRAFCTDPRVQELLTKAAATEDNYEMYAEIQKINNADIYYIPMFYLNSSSACTKGMVGVTIRMAGGMDFTYAGIPE